MASLRICLVALCTGLLCSVPLADKDEFLSVRQRRQKTSTSSDFESEGVVDTDVVDTTDDGGYSESEVESMATDGGAEDGANVNADISSKTGAEKSESMLEVFSSQSDSGSADDTSADDFVDDVSDKDGNSEYSEDSEEASEGAADGDDADDDSNSVSLIQMRDEGDESDEEESDGGNQESEASQDEAGKSSSTETQEGSDTVESGNSGGQVVSEKSRAGDSSQGDEEKNVKPTSEDLAVMAQIEKMEPEGTSVRMGLKDVKKQADHRVQDAVVNAKVAHTKVGRADARNGMGPRIEVATKPEPMSDVEKQISEARSRLHDDVTKIAAVGIKSQEIQGDIAKIEQQVQQVENVQAATSDVAPPPKSLGQHVAKLGVTPRPQMKLKAAVAPRKVKARVPVAASYPPSKPQALADTARQTKPKLAMSMVRANVEATAAEIKTDDSETERSEGSVSDSDNEETEDVEQQHKSSLQQSEKESDAEAGDDSDVKHSKDSEVEESTDESKESEESAQIGDAAVRKLLKKETEEDGGEESESEDSKGSASEAEDDESKDDDGESQTKVKDIQTTTHKGKMAEEDDEDA